MADTKSKTLIIALDAVSSVFFNPMYDAGELPNLASFFSDGLRVRSCIGVFPTVSPCNHGLVTYGLGPGKSNLVGLSWFNKRTHKYFNELSLGGILADLNKGIKSRNIFESSRHSLAFGPQLSRGSRTVLPIYATFAFGMADWATRLECLFIRNLNVPLNIYDNVYFGSLSSDHVGHAQGIDGIRENLKSLDSAFGELFKKLPADINVVIFSDHGNSPIDSDKAVRLGDILKDAGYRPTKRLREPDDCVICSTVVTYAHIYANGPTKRLAQALCGAPGVGIAMWRDREDGSIVVGNSDGIARVRRSLNRYSYTPEDADPLGYSSTDAKPGEWLTLKGWASVTYRETFPAAPPRIFDLFDSPNTGDVVLNFTGGHYPYFAGISQKCTHGSLHRDNITVPVLARGPRVKPGLLDWGVHEQLHTLLRDCVGDHPASATRVSL
ncbi:MAG TPA: alkaline phosphatase family protein [bacterium]|nr:alkaline phosphatase family protein [bacterium]